MATTMMTSPDTPPPVLDANSEGGKAPNPVLRGPVLLATDAAGTNDSVIHAAHTLARRLGVPLEVVAVVEPLETLVIEAPLPVSLGELEGAQRNEVAARERARLAQALGTTGWSLEVLTGHLVRVISDLAHRRQATVIVVGARGRSALDRLFARDTALHLLRVADRPVVAVPRSGFTLARHAIVAMDFSPASVHAAQAALLLLAEKATLTIVHVCAPMELGQPLRDAWDRSLHAGLAALFSRLRDELRPYKPSGVTIETRTVVGEVAKRVLLHARAVHADFIAVGSHGAGFFDRLFVGSVATSVVHHSTCTVLAAPAPPPAEAARIDLRLTGTTCSGAPAEWPELLREFSCRNVGRATSLEVADPELGVQIQETGYRLSGVTYDSHDKRVGLMLESPSDDRHHLTRLIGKVSSIAVHADAAGRDQALRLTHGRGQTLLSFRR